MNYGMIKYTLGWLLIFEAGFFLVPLITGLCFLELATFAFLLAMAIAAGIGTLLILKPPASKNLYAKDGFVIVALSWITLSLFGALPFMFCGATTNFADALFETVSGFTTTGATIFSDIESLPNCILIWRSFTNWIGGMGVLVFIMAFLPLGGAHNMNIMKAESPGPSVSKLVPKVKTTALLLYVIYFSLTLIQLILYLIGGATLFEAINISFSTAGTGGFSIKNDSFNSYSTYLQIVATVFMFLFSINFNSYFLLLKGKFKDAFNTEVKVFFIVVITAITIITIDIYSGFNTIGEAIKHAAFSVVSVISTTGFSTVDFNLWPELSRTFIVAIMFIGACAGSTGGGIKISRFVILFKGMARELKMATNPRQVKKISVDSRNIPHEVVRSVNSFIICFVAIFFFSVVALSFEEYDLITNFTAVASAMNNIGPGLELVGPYGNFGFFSVPSKLVLIFDMLAGRLELFPMLVLFTPSTWKK